MTRTVPATLAPIVERLELDQPVIVTLDEIRELTREFGIRTAPALVAHRLQTRGWLLKTGLSGAWEFAPGAHAGPHSRGGPLLPIQAALALEPNLPVSVALNSAAWVHGLADRAPAKVQVSVKSGVRVPAGLLRNVRVLRFDARLEPLKRKGVHVQRFESLLVHMAARPSQVKPWADVVEWLGDIVVEAVEADVVRELEDRPRAVRVRLAYLLQGVWPELSDRICSGTNTKVWFGPRQKLRRHSQRWRVADSLLPFDPAALARVRGV